MRPCAHHAMLLLALSCPSLALAAESRKDTASPRIDYQMDATRDEQLSQNSGSQQGRPVGTSLTPNSGAHKGTHDAGVLAATTSAPPATGTTVPANGPDPAYVGSGKVVNGWYYPPPQTTTVVTEYVPTRKNSP